MLNKLKEVYDADPTSEKATLVLNTLDLLTQNPDFNTQQTMLLVDQFLEKSLKLNDPNTFLTDEQVDSASQVLDNVLQYMSENCGNDYDLYKSMQRNAPAYLETLSRSTLNQALPTDNSSIITQNNFDIYTKRVEECKIGDLNIATSINAPTLTL